MAPVTIEVSRTMFYVSTLQEAFGYSAGLSGFIRSLAHHQYAFDIRNEIVFSVPAALTSVLTDFPDLRMPSPSEIPADLEALATGSFRCLVTCYVGCFFTAYGYTATSDQTIIAETGSLSVTDVNDGSPLGSIPMPVDGNQFSSAALISGALFSTALAG